jgi:hypothetical protein
MNPASHPIRFAAACLLLALRPALAAEPAATPQRAEALVVPTTTVVADAAPARQGGASAATGAIADAAASAPRAALDWSSTPRRAVQARRR